MGICVFSKFHTYFWSTLMLGNLNCLTLGKDLPRFLLNHDCSKWLHRPRTWWAPRPTLNIRGAAFICGASMTPCFPGIICLSTLQNQQVTFLLCYGFSKYTPKPQRGTEVKSSFPWSSKWIIFIVTLASLRESEIGEEPSFDKIFRWELVFLRQGLTL